MRRAAGMAALVITPATDHVSSAEILMVATVVTRACPQVAQVIYLHALTSIFNPWHNVCEQVHAPLHAHSLASSPPP